MTADVGIYTRCDSNYFPGLIALLNSLRRAGHSYPVYLVDTGLTASQLDIIASLGDLHVTRPQFGQYTLDSSKSTRYNTTVFAGLEITLPEHEVIVHLDADAVVLDSLEPLIQAAFEHGFAATGEIPPSNMKTHFWGMPEITGRALRDVTREEQIAAHAAITARFGPLDEETITFNSGIWATRRHYYLNRMRPVLEFIKDYHREIWGLEQAMLNIAAFYANPYEPFREVGSRFNSRAEYSYFNEHFGTSGYRIASPRLLTNLETARLDPGMKVRLNGVGGTLAVLHFVWKPKPWEEPSTLSEVWEFFADTTPGWRDAAAAKGARVTAAATAGWESL
ncbi:glycosyltransferase [Arthrobacter sp. GN70]|nr:glycosyltransferase [Arthrobacter sp. GN70]MBT8162611.1 glycosyltransferase [Arthrobacter sp. GN70]